MTLNQRLLRVKDAVLLILAVVCAFVCTAPGKTLPSAAAEWEQTSVIVRSMTNYMRENYLPIIFFFFFVTAGLTSLMLGYIIYRRFDRNRDAAAISVKTGVFFLIAAVYFLTCSQNMYVLPQSREKAAFIAASAMLVMPLPHISAGRPVYNKKWINVSEWVFSALAAAFFAAGILGAPRQVFSAIVLVSGGMFFLLMCVFGLQRLHDLLGMRTDGKWALIIAIAVQCGCLPAAAVSYALRQKTLFILFLGVALAMIAYVIFAETLSLAARQYIKTADYEDVRKMAYVDGLCGIGNRNAFMLEQEASFDCDSLCYIVFDLNGLKGVNDRYGHAEGDRMIQRAAELIEETFGDFGKCFRIGGDEFAVIGRYKNEAQIKRRLRELKKRIDSDNCTAAYPLDLACGYALRQTTDVSTYELYKKADKEMYRFKKRAKALAKS